MAIQAISLITLGVADIARSKRFYREGFGWTPALEMEDVGFYQMNGLVFAIWEDRQLAGDMQRASRPSGGFALAHNVASADEVIALVQQLIAAGATQLREPDAPSHGGFRGYVADPDGHAWEIAWNPGWPIDSEGRVTIPTAS